MMMMMMTADAVPCGISFTHLCSHDFVGCVALLASRRPRRAGNPRHTLGIRSICCSALISFVERCFALHDDNSGVESSNLTING